MASSNLRIFLFCSSTNVRMSEFGSHPSDRGTSLFPVRLVIFWIFGWLTLFSPVPKTKTNVVAPSRRGANHVHHSLLGIVKLLLGYFMALWHSPSYAAAPWVLNMGIERWSQYGVFHRWCQCSEIAHDEEGCWNNEGVLVECVRGSSNVDFTFQPQGCGGWMFLQGLWCLSQQGPRGTGEWKG